MEKHYWWLESDTAAKLGHTRSDLGGSGSIQTLPMTETQKKRARKRPIGFTAEFPKKRG